MTFSTPLAFLLLLFIPYFVWLGRPVRESARWRDWASLALRLFILSLLIFSLAGAQTVRAADELAVVFLVDASDSIGPEQEGQAEAFVRQAIEEMGPNDKAAVIYFGANALVERPMSGLAELAPVASVPVTLQSDLAEAMRLGLALFPPGAARRMVLISDGQQTVGDALEAARLVAASGVAIDIVPLSRPGGEDEVLLTSVEAPTRVSLGEAFNIDIAAESTVSTAADLRVLAGGAIVYDEVVQLQPGMNQFTLKLQATEQEFARYVVQLTPQRDTYFQNNQLAAFTEIVGPPRVLLVAPDGTLDDNGDPVPEESAQLQVSLESTGLLVDRVTPAELSSSLESLSDYATIVLVDVNAKNLSPRKMLALQQYVRDLGGGLVTVGGPHSYGMGGYFRTPLEESLPVEMQIKDQQRFPSVSIVIVIDRSGSMAAQEGGLTKIQLAAEGAVRVVELLNDFDEIAVIPVDTQPDNPIGPLPASQREEIIDRIRLIGAGGGGIYVRTGLEAAARALENSTNQVRHVIVLADGADSEQKEGVPQLIQALTDQGVTVSTVSIGAGPDVPWLQQMAELGEGRFHFTDQAANLPQIFTQETTSIQRTYLIEERFFPSLSTSLFARRHPIFQAMESGGLTQVPPLYGYVGTSPKATAQVILETRLGDPLLATWEYGLGRAVAWTSDATGRWATDWIRWQGFPTFWSNVVRWSLVQARESNLETSISYGEEQAQLVVDARNSDGAFINGLDLEANVVDPQGTTIAVPLQQVAPGRYEGSFAPSGDGAYFLRVAGSDPEAQLEVGQTSGWILGYSPEYRQLQPNPQLLSSIGALSGGRTLAIAPATVGSVFDHDLPATRATRPIWPWLIGLAVVLLPADIAVRRLAIGRRELRKAWAVTFGRIQPEVAPPARRSEQVARLFQAKHRAAVNKGEGHPTESAPAVGSPTAGPSAATPPPASQRAAGAQAGPAPAAPSDQDGDTLASRLLEKRRRQGENPADKDGGR